MLRSFSPDDPNVRRLVMIFARQAVRKLDLPQSSSEDIAQTVLMKLSSLSQDNLEGVRNIPAYLIRAVRNEAANFYRRVEHETTGDIFETLEETHSVVVIDSVEAGILLKEIWKQLDDKERRLLELMILGYNDKEISRRLQISHSSARKRVSRLREKINLLVA